MVYITEEPSAADAAPNVAASYPGFDFATYSGGMFTNNDSLFGLIFEDPAKNYGRDSTIAAGIASATDGALRAAISVVPANGDYLTAQGPLDVADFATIAAATSIENSSIGLDGTITYQNWPVSHFSRTSQGAMADSRRLQRIVNSPSLITSTLRLLRHKFLSPAQSCFWVPACSVWRCSAGGSSSSNKQLPSVS